MNRKMFLFILIMLCNISFIYTQDLIVTHEGDSLNCRITKMKGGNVHFIFNHKGEVRSTLLPKSQITQMTEGFYETAEVSEDEMPSYMNYNKFRAKIKGGGSYMTAEVSDDYGSEFEDYLKELKSGVHFGANIHYFVSESWGIGLQYSNFNTSSQLDDWDIEESVTIQFIGPSVCNRLFTANEKTELYAICALGYLEYLNDASYDYMFELHGNTVGVYYGLAFDYLIFKDIYFDVELSLVSGSLNELKYDDGTYSETIELDSDELENISRADFSIGITWQL